LTNWRAGDFVAAPNFGVALIAVACVLEFALCLRASGEAAIPTSLLVANGALTPRALEPGQWRRLLAYGCLHANPTTLAAERSRRTGV
jgi:hypothetical protein